ncbi:LacI family DNA-binding transcriptional regulator [Salinibacterium sp. SWN248]|uniref:LacI family DNA-binding transcriptional regulator n=1 Tax=Salinibacterium sp. SWN248 TaxID=2792056 RepID=UPI0018CF9811|nr:LacI family DNA-binding transcriptional regulator [Salinibacterium sp. SWN248]MBH0023063.1 LacI family DNA-binding transcriptional regulator [Salinibacterium sp. SWN248]
MTTNPSTDSQGDRKPTLRDIAEQAGVSVPTVSKVVKGRKDVSAATRARIQELLTEHGYRSPLSSADAGAIELHFDSLTNTNVLRILEGVIAGGEAAGLDVVVKITPRDFGGRRWVDIVTEAHHSGLILVTSRLDEKNQDEFSRAGVPLVVIDPANTPKRPLPSVGANNFNGGYLATRHLIDLGHTNIAIVQGISSECANARLAGYHSALQSAGIAPNPEYLVNGGFQYAKGREAAQQLLSLPTPPTAIFATNDLEALGVLDAARGMGVGIPRDLSVVGFDDAVQATSASPRLTTVKQPFLEIGSTAVQMLAQLLEGQTLATHRLELATELVVRDSTGPVPV